MMEGDKVTVLLLEDEADHAELIKLHLSKEPEVGVDCASSLAEARKVLKERDVDVVVADYVLEGERGSSLLRELKSEDRRVPFIILTGRGDEKSAQEALRLGADDYLTKDEVFADFSLLSSSIKRVVSDRRQSLSEEKFESELRLYHRLNEEIVRYSPIGIALINREGKLVFGNPSLFSIMDSNPKDVIGQDVLSLKTMEQFGISDFFRRAFEKATPFEIKDSYFITTLSKKELYLTWSGTPLRNKRGEVDRVLTLVFDTTKRKLAEIRAKSLLTRLKVSSKLSWSILYNLDFPEILFLLGKEVGKAVPHLLSISFIKGAGEDRFIARYLPEEGKLVILSPAEVKLGKGRLSFLLDYKRPFLVKRINPELWSREEHRFLGKQASALAFLPLAAGGRFFGTLLVSFAKEIDPEVDFGFLKDLASSLSLALEMTRLYQELKHSHEQMLLLNQLSKRLNSVIDSKEIAAIAVSELPRILGVRLCSLFIYEGKTKTFRLLGHNHPDLGESIEIVISAERDSLLSKVASRKEPLLVKDVEEELGISNKLKYRSRSFLGVPLIMGNELIGVLNLNDKLEGDQFTEADLEVVAAMAEHLTAALTNSLRYQHTLDLSQRDSLTGLYSHRFFQEVLVREIARADRYGTRISLLMGDLDHFKEINDRYGHQVGDLILSEIAAIFNKNTRLSDTVARYGGEEFSIILPDTSGEEGFAMAERIRKRVEDELFTTASGELSITISFGVAEYRGGIKPAELIELADRALYRAKAGGRNRVELS
jgi:diguanylate cyclase (GGDEF)-like protein/PAS domain S-box-containing protein